MSRELRELLGEFDAYGPSEGVYQVATERARVLTGTSDSRLPKVGRVFAIGAALAALTVCIALLALAAHSRSTAPRNDGSNTKLRPVTQAQLDVLVTSLRVPLLKLNAQILIANTALDAYKANPTPATALRWRQVILNALGRIGHDVRPLKSIVVPRPLTPAWTDFVRSESNDGASVVITGSDLGNNATPDLLPLNYVKPIDHLKVVLLLCVAANHLKLPAWVGGLGTGTPNMPIVDPVMHPGLPVFVNVLAPRIYKLQQDITFATTHLHTYMTASTVAGVGSLEGLRMIQAAGRIHREDYASLMAMTVPPHLRPAWTSFMRMVQATATAIRVEGTYVKDNNLRAAKAGRRAYIRKVEQPIVRLKTALAKYAARTHAKLPDWINKLGTGT